MSFKLIFVRHRHPVFTIDEHLRDYFLEDRDLLNCLFDAVRSVLLWMFRKMNKSKNYTPGFIMVLHAFGRDLKWNPHVHCLLTEGGYSDDGFWKNVHHFNYNYLRNAFRTALLNKMEKIISPSFKQKQNYQKVYFLIKLFFISKYDFLNCDFGFLQMMKGFIKYYKFPNIPLFYRLFAKKFVIDNRIKI